MSFNEKIKEAQRIGDDILVLGRETEYKKVNILEVAVMRTIIALKVI